MRQKTDAKRQDILRIAKTLFLKHGLEAVSMSQIAAELGGSKGTLYSYFENKDDLFVEVALDVIQKMIDATSETFDPTLPVADNLRLLGLKYVKFGLSNDVIALRRNLMNYPRLGKKGKDAYNHAIQGIWGRMAKLIEGAMNDGILKKSDPWLATMQLRSLFELDMTERRQLNIDAKADQKEIERNIDRGLEIFFSHYKKI